MKRPIPNDLQLELHLVVQQIAIYKDRLQNLEARKKEIEDGLYQMPKM